MKTIQQALLDEIYYPIQEGKVDNILIMRQLDGEATFTREVGLSNEYKGALADCLYSLIQAVNFSEADKSVSAPTDKDKKRIFQWMNSLYKEIGEEEKADGDKPKIIVRDFLL